MQLYRAKHGGRNRVMWRSDDELFEDGKGALHISAPTSIDKSSFGARKVVYTPEIDHLPASSRKAAAVSVNVCMLTWECWRS